MIPLLKKTPRYRLRLPLWGCAVLLILLAVSGCARKALLPSPLPKADFFPVRYTIQAGAFSTAGNAIRLTQTLERKRLSAYYFHDKSGLFKVRFGDFASRNEALLKAQALVHAGIIGEYYIVSLQSYSAAKSLYYDAPVLRRHIVETAENFIGLPYQWGGSSPEEGFDCSGLVMAVYQLNGFNLPRCSQDQFVSGDPVDRSQLKKGDLVFFSFSRPGKISHVGVYTGDNSFIHAPGEGKSIRKDTLSDDFFATRYAGARTYLR